jgi:Zn-dependent peptidase ImmA (M78 family)
MERIQFVNAERIRWCCADRGITVTDLARETGIAVATLERLGPESTGLTYKQLRKIADFFGRGVLFFIEPDPVNEASVHTPQFRSLANQKPELSPKLKTLIERVERQRDVYLSLKEDLDDAEQPAFDPPPLPVNDVPEAARLAREWLAIGAENTFDTYRAAVEAKGILVFRSNGYKGQWQIAKESPILGFSLYDPQCPVIVVKKLSYEPRQSFTLIHELAHVLLHRESSIDDENDLVSQQGWEREANAFAGRFLVPDSFLATISDRARPNDVTEYENWLEGPRREWGVSVEVILRRLMDQGRLERNLYIAYRTWRAGIAVAKDDEGGSRAYRHREPKHVFGDTFVKTVLSALNARQITLAKASSYLDTLKITDLHKLERHYAGL